ncbi:hypothetical protein CRD59_05500 [Bifidobacterium xylocopae]|uniref:Transmembrane protein alanine and leucine rich n=2 Tax=Bifidobacterium xylocopae TaxID=2493119 RepID=A0A366KBQ3_9BIFI|nr:hypothetical protein CRD59_05500 [Bifidobacterium xylocopae]
MWTLPIHQIDAPSHYYSIRKLLKHGLPAALHLLPNDSYYPPLFHLLVCLLIKACGLFGLTLNIFTGLNIVWIISSGIAFPAGMLLWCSYFLRGVAAPYRAALSVILPVLAVSCAAHPFWMLAAGPLIAYGLATSLLPYLMYASLRLIDALVKPEERSPRSAVCWALVNIALGLLVLFAHPRIAFTYLVFIAFFIILKLPWKVIASAAGALCLAVLMFAAYVMRRDHGKDYFNPSSWFHTFEPTRSVPDALRVVVTDFLPGLPGVIMAICIVAAVLATILLSGDRRKDGIALLASYLLTGLVFVCSAAVTGPFANIVTAAWYRGETRPLTMIPLAVVPLLAFGASCMLPGKTVDDGGGDTGAALCAHASAWKEYRQSTNASLRRVIAVAGICVLAALAVLANTADPTRAALTSTIESNVSLDQADPREQLTRAKYQVLTDVKRRVEPDAVIISDPMNGSMYGSALYGMDMLYPVYNPMDTKKGKVFGDVERAFASGDADLLLHTVCPVETTYAPRPDGRTPSPKYFLTMGPQAPSLQMFTYKAQYYPFHDRSLIDSYEHSGTLIKVKDYNSLISRDQSWSLYRFACR